MNSIVARTTHSIHCRVINGFSHPDSGHFIEIHQKLETWFPCLTCSSCNFDWQGSNISEVNNLSKSEAFQANKSMKPHKNMNGSIHLLTAPCEFKQVHL